MKSDNSKCTASFLWISLLQILYGNRRLIIVPIFVAISDEIQHSLVSANALVCRISCMVQRCVYSDEGACDGKVGLIKGLEKEA